MDELELAATLRRSISQQEQELRSSLILNPVENVPFDDDLSVVGGPLHGLYTSDKVRTRAQRLETPIQFAGRGHMEDDSRLVYAAWARALGAEDASLRALSGIHAHLILFLSISAPGQTVLLLPVQAGGHVVGRAILERLGLRVIDMVADDANMCVDVEATVRALGPVRPEFVFVDRSEGLVVEDLSALAALATRAAVFDASQYLTNIVCGDHPNPFRQGFDLVVSTLHKNFPGPQKALFACRERGDVWDELVRGASTYVSNLHMTSTYAAGLTLTRRDWLAKYSRVMLSCAPELEDALAARDVPVVTRRRDSTPTHHLWVQEGSRARAFSTYEALERCRILTNYRELPYSLGPGLRLGLAAAVRTGMDLSHIDRLAELISDIRRCGPTADLQNEARTFNEMIWSLGTSMGEADA